MGDTALDFISLDIDTLRAWLSKRLPGPVPVALERFLAGTANDDDRLLLAHFAATHGDAYPRTCEALTRELDRTVR